MSNHIHNLNVITLSTLLFALTLVPTFAGSEHLIKQKAKDIRDQNNERQGEDTGSATGRIPQPNAPSTIRLSPSSPRPSTPALPPQVVRIGAALEEISGADEPTDQQKLQLIQRLTEAVRGEVKPSVGKLQKLGRNLAIAVAGIGLTSSQQITLAGQIDRAFNESLDARQMEALAGKVQDTLRAAGAGKVDAAVVSNDLKSIIAEIQRGAKH